MSSERGRGVTGRTEPSPSKLGCVQSHEQPAARDRVPSRRAAPKPHPTLPCCAPVRGDCTVTPDQPPRPPLRAPAQASGLPCRGCPRAGPSADDPPPEKALPLSVLPGLGPPTKPLLFFFWCQPQCPQKQRLHGGPVPLSGIQAPQCPPPPAGTASPPPPPSATSCPCQPLGSQETGLLCSDSGPALCAKPALLPLWGVTSPLKSLTVRSC